MHILKIIHGYPPLYNAGSEVYSQSVVNQLSKTHKITVFTREEDVYKPDFKFSNSKKGNTNFVHVNMARAKDGYNHETLNQKFAKLIRKIKPDIAHVGHLNHLSTGIIDELHLAKIPIIFTLHDFWLMCPRGQFLQVGLSENKIFELCHKQKNEKCATVCYNRYFSGQKYDYERDKKYWTSWIATRMKTTKDIINKVSLFVAPSKFLMNRFIKEFGVPTEKIIYLDYGFPTNYLKPVNKSKSEVYTFGYIGTHIPAKGVNLLIQAFSKLETPAKLKIFGRYDNQNTKILKKLAEKSKNEIEFCGEYKNENIVGEVFEKIDAIVVPSIWGENSPLVIHEAQACHVPIITADFGGMKEYVNHQVNGLLFEHRNAESLFEQLKFATENPNLMKKYGLRGYLFSENGKVPSIEKHCEKLVRNCEIV